MTDLRGTRGELGLGNYATALPTAPTAGDSARRETAAGVAQRLIARRSQRLLRLYGAFCKRDLTSYFHRIRLLGELPDIDGPVVLCANHPSWWDVEIYGWLGATLFADRLGFAPMDAPNLKRYNILERFGAFAVYPNDALQAHTFFAVAEHVLGQRNGLLAIAVEGRYRDVRVRPVAPMPGLALLARRVPAATFIPVALEYVFWSERRPNALISFGTPIRGAELAACKLGEATARIAEALETTMSTLAEAGQSRDPARFSVLLQGRDGMSGMVDLWRRWNAAIRGTRFQKAYREEGTPRGV